jgi:hypothetical protein
MTWVNTSGSSSNVKSVEESQKPRVMDSKVVFNLERTSLEKTIRSGIERIIKHQLQNGRFKSFRDMGTNTYVITSNNFDGNWDNIDIVDLEYRGQIHGFGYDIFELKENGN